MEFSDNYTDRMEITTLRYASRGFDSDYSAGNDVKLYSKVYLVSDDAYVTGVTSLQGETMLFVHT